jgi:flagellar biogenesis protein FliO
MSWSFWVNYFLALAIVGLMLGGLYFIMRGLSRGRVFSSANRRLVTVLETTMLAQHVHVHVLKVGERYLLIGGSNGSVSTLAELGPDEVEGWLAQQRANVAGARSLMAAMPWVRDRTR